MSGDLEDFLRRAAQRRQAKAARSRDAQGQAGGDRSRPKYSNRKTERIVSADDADEEVLMAEVVEDDRDSIAVRMQRIEAAKRKAAATAELTRRKTKTAAPGSAPGTQSGIPLTGHLAEDLLKLLRQPGGVQQAILLKEILDRPEHRW